MLLTVAQVLQCVTLERHGQQVTRLAAGLIALGWAAFLSALAVELARGRVLEAVLFANLLQVGLARAPLLPPPHVPLALGSPGTDRPVGAWRERIPPRGSTSGHSLALLGLPCPAAYHLTDPVPLVSTLLVPECPHH